MRTSLLTLCLTLALACDPSNDAETGSETDSQIGSETSSQTDSDPTVAGPFINSLDEADFAALSLDDVRYIATTSSAPQAYLRAIFPMLLIDSDDQGCPQVIETDDSISVTGDCTDELGQEWFGSLSGTSDSGMTFSSFGFRYPYDCDGEEIEEYFEVDGTFTWTVSTPDSDTEITHYQIDTLTKAALQEIDCTLPLVTEGFVYEGVWTEVWIDDGEATDPSWDTDDTDPFPTSYSVSSWEGSGLVGIEGIGRYSATTADQVVDEVICEYEAAEGTSTFITSEQEIVITYDGATDCSEQETVQWSLNGESQGELEGVACSTTGSSGGLLALPLLILGLLGRRRRS